MLLEETWDKGWQTVALDEVALGDVLRHLQRHVGTVTSSELRIKTPDEARPRSLSARYGTGAFPHHSDFAFRPTPPRLIVLVNSGARSFRRTTALSSLRGLPDMLDRSLTTSMWHLHTARGAFLVSGRYTLGRHIVGRWDVEFLQPSNSAAWACTDALPATLSERQVEHVWGPMTALIVDNWNCTHARSPSAGPADDEQRRLTRYEVWHHAGMDN